MRVLAVGIVLVLATSAAGIYAAAAGDSECSGTITVDSPTSSAVTLGWLLNADSKVTAAEVTWTPNQDSDYALAASVGVGSGSLAIEASGAATRTDIVPISPFVDSRLLSLASLAITDTGLPTSEPATVGWLMDSDGQVTSAKVTWVPETDSAYVLSVTLEDAGGSVFIGSAGTEARTDDVPLSPSVPAEDAHSVSVCATLS